MKTISKTFSALEDAEQYHNELYEQYNCVKLIHSPLSGEEGMYVWEVENVKLLTKKKPQMETIQTLGKILEGPQERDCIHIALFPCIVAEDDIGPGDEVALVYKTKNHIKKLSHHYGKPIGIVDPFIKDVWNLKKGQQVWVLLNPGSTTGMRHEFQCDAIDNPPVAQSPSEDWLRAFADKWNFNYDEMIEEARHSEGGYATAQGIDLHSRTELDAGDEELFWEHISMLTGQTFTQEHKENFGWSCTC